MKKIPFLLLLVVLVCVSCSKGNKTVLKASFQRYQGSDAKAVLTGENYLMWTSGDLIRINEQQVRISGDGSDAVFEMEESSNGYAAIFPYSAVSSAPNGSADVNIRVFSNGQAYSVANDGVSQLISAPMAAYSPNSTGNVDLMFSNLCSLIKVTIMNDDEPPLGKSVKPYQIQVYNKTCFLQGNGVVENLSSNPTLVMLSSGSSKSTSLNITDISIPCGEQRDFYVVVPPIANAASFKVMVYYTRGASLTQECVYKVANGLFSLPANNIAAIDFTISE